ncbi:MAG: division/cell wall cluster transcriptional repressor MraZ, partial [Treponema sp.]|nr:division/cell wall cluster transcriptional repressor MraZ [Treponema sp.]
KLEKAASALSEDEYLDLQYQYVLPAQVVEIDKSGRIAVPSAIRKYARLNRDCLVLSAENRLELWDAEFFWTYLQERRVKNQETMQKLGPIRLFNMSGF